MGNGVFGFLSGGLTGNVDSNIATPQIDLTQVNQGVQQSQTGNTAQGQAMGETQQAYAQAQQLAEGNGPSAATALLNQNTQQSQNQQNALASSGAGATGLGLARRQAMMQNASTTQQLGGAAATARAQEQLGGLSQQGQLAGQLGTQGATQQAGSLNQASLYGNLATNQAQLQNSTNQLNEQAQVANQSNAQKTMGSIAGMAAGAVMMSDPKAKTDVASADSKTAPPEDSKGYAAQVQQHMEAPQSQSQPQAGPRPLDEFSHAVRQRHAGLYNADKMGPVVPPVSQDNPNSPQMQWLAAHGLRQNGDEVTPPTFNAEDLPRAPERRQIVTDPRFGDMVLSSPPDAKDDIEPAADPDYSNVGFPDEGPLGAHSYEYEDSQSHPDDPLSQRHMGPMPGDYGGAQQGGQPSSTRNAIAGALLGFSNPASVGALKQAQASQKQAEAQNAATQMFLRQAGVQSLPITGPPPPAAGTQPSQDSGGAGSALQGILGGDSGASTASGAADASGAAAALSSPPEAKVKVQDASIGGALRKLRPYSYSYKDPANEPIPAPRGRERFFGVMTTDLKKHPVTKNLVFGQPGAHEKVSVPAATSFNLASSAHLQAQHDGLARRLSAVEHIMGLKGSRHPSAKSKRV